MVVADQRMPGMTGVELLAEAKALFPPAKSVLLTAYADTDAAISAINRMRLDYYVLKPWDPPEERLYPVLDDLLDDWRAFYRPAFEGVRVVGHRWSADGHRLRDFLARNLVPYQWLDVETSEEAVRLLAASAPGGSDGPTGLPAVVLSDGTVLRRPSNLEVAQRIGLRTTAHARFFDVLIVGGGPAGLAAAVYAASEGLTTALVEREAPGGQAGQSSLIENYLGFPQGLSGSDLARRALTQTTLTILRHKLRGGIEVERDYATDLPRLSVHGGGLNQVWTNLLDNAIDAMGGKGRIRVRTFRLGDDVAVEITDDGPGIPPELQSRVFDPFFTQGAGPGHGPRARPRLPHRRAGPPRLRLPELGAGSDHLPGTPASAPVTSPATAGEVTYGSPAGRWVILATVLGSGMAFLDGTVVNVALPAIAGDLGTGLSGLQWTLDAYLVTLAALLLLGGSLGDVYGRRQMYLVGLVGFTAASVLCGLAPGTGALVAARALQGVGAALLVPGSLAILSASFRPADRSRAIGAWSGLAGVATALGPFVGGWLIDSVSWRLVFLLNVPFAVVAAVVALRHVPESRDPAGVSHPDVAGAAAVSIGLGAVAYALIEGASGFGPSEVAAAIAGIGALAAFVVIERRRRHPMLPLELFRSRQFSGANVTTFAVYAALGGASFLLVLHLQVVLGYSALAAGASLLPVTVLMLTLSSRTAQMAQRGRGGR